LLWHLPCILAEKKQCADNPENARHNSTKGDIAVKLKLMMLVLLSLFATLAVNASAQETDQVAKANVPFDFYAGGQEMPAGSYVIGLDLETRMTSLADASGQRKIFLMGIPADLGEDKSELVFEHIGNMYLLKEVKSDVMDVTFRTRVPEEAMQSRMASPQVEVALNR
jgi:hypothetical protein